MCARLVGRYHIVREIDAGAMGRVFQAVDTETGRTVAAKVLIASPEVDLHGLLRFQQEGAVLAALRHPNIVQVFGTHLEEDTSSIIMEFLEGRSLARILRIERLTLARTKRLMLQVAAALAFAHRRGIVHRDVKPSNVVVVGNDRVKVTDFGIARVVREGSLLRTGTGASLGTPLYMSPEQIEGRTVDGRSDIYSFGVMLYEMVTGRPPFQGDDPVTVAFQHVHKAPEPPSTVNADLPDSWEEVILRCLAKRPDRRYQTADALHDDLSELEVEPVVRQPRTVPATAQVESLGVETTTAEAEARSLYSDGQARELAGDLRAALKTYRAALTVVSSDVLAAELEAAVARVTGKMVGAEGVTGAPRVVSLDAAPEPWREPSDSTEAVSPSLSPEQPGLSAAEITLPEQDAELDRRVQRWLEQARRTPIPEPSALQELRRIVREFHGVMGTLTQERAAITQQQSEEPEIDRESAESHLATIQARRSAAEEMLRTSKAAALIHGQSRKRAHPNPERPADQELRWCLWIAERSVDRMRTILASPLFRAASWHVWLTVGFVALIGLLAAYFLARSPQAVLIAGGVLMLIVAFVVGARLFQWLRLSQLYADLVQVATDAPFWHEQVIKRLEEYQATGARHRESNRRALEAIDERSRLTVADLQSRAAHVERSLGFSAAAWTDPLWQSWKPSGRAAVVTRFGLLAVQSHGQLLRLPALAPLPGAGHLIVKSASAAMPAVVEALESVVLRLLATIAPDQLQIDVLDMASATGSGMILGWDRDTQTSEIIRGIYRSADEAEKVLCQASEAMRTTIRERFLGDGQHLDDQDQHTIQEVETYRVLLVLGLPSALSPHAVRALEDLASGGPRCGTYILLALKDSEWSPEEVVTVIEESAVTVEWRADRFVWNDGDFGACTLQLDTPPQAGHRVLREFSLGPFPNGSD